jgi:DNA-binding CsgD family transcriptional regulator
MPRGRTLCRDLDNLTPAQRAVYVLLLEGYQETEIARIRGTATQTVKNQMQIVRENFDVKHNGRLIVEHYKYRIDELQAAAATAEGARHK